MKTFKEILKKEDPRVINMAYKILLYMKQGNSFVSSVEKAYNNDAVISTNAEKLLDKYLPGDRIKGLKYDESSFNKFIKDYKLKK